MLSDPIAPKFCFYVFAHNTLFLKKFPVLQTTFKQTRTEKNKSDLLYLCAD